MSDIFADNSAPADTGATNLDVLTATDLPASSGETVETAAAPIPVVTTTLDTSAKSTIDDSTDPFELSDAETDEIFGIAPEKPETQTDAEEIPAEIPLPDGTDKPDESVTTDTMTAPETDAANQTEDLSDKNDWKTAPETFRDEFKTLKRELNETKANSLERTFLLDAEKALEMLEGKSQIQFQNLVQIAANKAAQANPEGWIDVFVQNFPDLVAQKLLGDEKLTKTRLLAERETVDPELFNDWEDDNSASALDSPDKQELETLRKQRAADDESALYQQKETLKLKIAAPITDSVDRVYRDAGLEVLPTDTPRQKAFKELIGRIMPIYIASELATDQEIAPVYNQATKLVDGLDEQGATELQFTLVSFAEDKAEEFASYLTELMASHEKVKELPKETVKPPVVVAASANAGGALPADSIFTDNFDTTDAEWDAIVRGATR